MRSVRDPATGRVFATTGDEVCAWIEANCVFTDGVWLGQPFRLIDWQRRLLWELFECNPVTRQRRYRTALVGLPRKQGKSEVAAAIGLCLAFGEGDPSAKVYCAAASEDQADVVYDKARRMVEMGPLAETVTVPAGTRVSQPKLHLTANPYQFVQRLSSKGATKHGLNPAAVILDELHVWSTGQADELYQALTTAMAARPNGLILAITTAGSDLEVSRCGALYTLGRKLQSGEVDDPSFFFRWWSAPEGCALDDEAAIAAANPSLGTIVDMEFYRSERHRVPEGDFRRLYLNQWIDYGAAPWVTGEQVEACSRPLFDLDAHAPAWVGIDLSESRDATGVAWGQWRDPGPDCGHEGQCLMVRARAWERPLGPSGQPLDGWEVPQAEVREHLLGLNAGMTVVTNVFDPWHSKLMQQDLAAQGIGCEVIWQSGQRRAGASAALYDLIAAERLHWCDEVVGRHLLAATTVPAGRDGGYYLAKRREGRVMDVAMALVNVVYGTAWAPAPVESSVVLYVPPRKAAP